MRSDPNRTSIGVLKHKIKIPAALKWQGYPIETLAYKANSKSGSKTLYKNV